MSSNLSKYFVVAVFFIPSIIVSSNKSVWNEKSKAAGTLLLFGAVNKFSQKCFHLNPVISFYDQSDRQEINNLNNSVCKLHDRVEFWQKDNVLLITINKILLKENKEHEKRIELLKTRKTYLEVEEVLYEEQLSTTMDDEDLLYVNNPNEVEFWKKYSILLAEENKEYEKIIALLKAGRTYLEAKNVLEEEESSKIKKDEDLPHMNNPMPPVNLDCVKKESLRSQFLKAANVSIDLRLVGLQGCMKIELVPLVVNLAVTYGLIKGGRVFFDEVIK